MHPAGAQTPVQTIELKSFAFNPSPIHLKSGQAVTLHFTNTSGSAHDFTAKRFFAASRILSGKAPDGEVDLGAHQSATITLVPVAGHYNVHCSHFMHKQLGMNAKILVD
jgi:plastocyanin